MKRNYKEKRIEVEGRIFQIEFWEDHNWSIPLYYVCVSEILLVTKRCWGTAKTSEVKREIAKTWGADNRVEWAMYRIESELKSEKERAKDCQDIEDFCNGIPL